MKIVLSNVLSIILIIAAVFQPLAPVFALEQALPATSESANAQVFALQTNAPSTASVRPADADAVTGAAATPAAAGASATTPPVAVSQNQYKVQPQVDATTGAMTFDYPLDVPAGVNGLTPNLVLSYNSQNAEEGSAFGYGWNMSGIPEISRINKTGINNFYGMDGQYTYNWNLFSSLSGEIISVGDNAFQAKSEDGSFIKYAYDPASQKFTATDKNGTVYVFGADNGSRVYDQSNPANIYKWAISSITDANGNSMAFLYHTGAGQIQPSVINYGPYQIVFISSNRNDSIINYKPGFRSSIYQIISEIQVKFNGTIQKRYILNYKAGDNGARSLLNSVQVYGYPATTFDYTKSSAPNWVQSSSVTLSPDTNLSDGSSIAVDFNGDGYMDILTSYQNSSGNHKSAYLNKGDGTWVLAPAYTPPDIFVSKVTGLSYGWAAFDVNGDRLPDLVQSFKTDPNPAVRNTYLNTGSGWSLDASLGYQLPVTLIWNNLYGNAANMATVADLNGDGLMDFSVYESYRQYGLNVGTFLNNSGATNGFRAIDPWSTAANYSDTKMNYADVNADGVDDAIYDNGDCSAKNLLYVGNGNGTWISDFPASPHSYCNNKNSWNSDWGSRVFDINGDGLADLVYATVSSSGYVDHSTYLNTGNGWVQNQNFALPQSINFSSATGTGIGGFLDLNGDGLPELYSNGTVYVNQNAKKTDLLSSITYPAGGTSAISYKSSAQYKDASGNLLNQKLPVIVQTVNTVTTIDSVNNVVSTDTYNYAGGAFYFNQYNLRGKKVAGFAKVSKRDSAGNTVVSYYHTASGDNGTLGIYVDFYSEKIGKMYRQEVYGPDSKIYSVDIYHWDIDFKNYSASNFVFLKEQVHEDLNGQSGRKDTAVSYAYDNANGNLLSKTNYGRVLASDDGNYGDFGADGTSSGVSDTMTTSYSYATNGLGVYKVSRENVTDAGSNKIKETRYYYDNLPLGKLASGNQTKQEAWTGLGYLSTQKSYYPNGLVKTFTDANGNVASYAYDNYGLYPVSITNPLNQTTNISYDYASGKPKRVQDSNNYVRETDYDGLGRPTQERASDRTNPSTLNVLASYTYTDTANATSAKKSVYASSSNAIDSYTYFDGLGRAIQTKTNFGNGNWQTADIAYNSTGQVQKQSLPYLTQTYSRTSATGDSTLYDTLAYDPLYRRISDTNVLGTASTQYLNWQTTATDRNGNKKDFINDAYGRLVQVNEYNTDGTYATSYQYDLLGNLTNITDALGNVRNFTYDQLGRRLTAEDLHAPGDATFGKYIYTYDNNGNIKTKTDAIGIVTTYVYDSLNRIKSEAVGTTTNVVYSYDTCLNGALCSVTQPLADSKNPAAAYTYYADGLPKTETKNIQLKAFVQSYTYDLMGNSLTQTLPNSDQQKNIYDQQEKLNQVLSQTNGASSFSPVVSNLAYAPNSQLGSMLFANNITQTNTFDATKAYQLRRKLAATSTGTKLQDLNYIYDNVGNITNLVDASQTNTAKTVNYSYDNLYRMLSATVSGAANNSNYAQNYTYDAIGNILTNSQLGSYYYNPTDTANQYANPDAVYKIGAQATGSMAMAAAAMPGRIVPEYSDSPVLQSYSGPVFSGSGFSAELFQAPAVQIPETVISAEIPSIAPVATPTDASPIEKLPIQKTPIQAIPPFVPLMDTVTPTDIPAINTVPSPTSWVKDVFKFVAQIFTPSIAHAAILTTTGSVTISNNTITGWACDPNYPTTALQVHIYADKDAGSLNNFLTIVTANQTSADPVLTQKCPNGGTAHGFTYQIPYWAATNAHLNLLDGNQHTFYVYAINATPNEGPNPLIGQVIYKASLTTTGSVSVSNNTITGWACDPNYPTTALQVHIYADKDAGSLNNFLTIVTANQTSADPVLTQKCPNGGTAHGFTYTIPSGTVTNAKINLQDGNQHTFYVYAINATPNEGPNPLIGQVGYQYRAVSVPTPTITPITGTYTAIQTITLSDALPEANIYYTTDGTMPTTSSTLYSGPFTLSASATVKAIAAKSGYSNSGLAYRIYTINVPVATTTSLVYDKNGNLTGESGMRNAVYTYDYKNQLTGVTIKDAAGNVVSISTYLYDHTGQRIYAKDVTKNTAGTITSSLETYYPSKNYSETWDTLTAKKVKVDEHVFAGDLLVATVEYVPNASGTLVPKTQYHIADQRNSTQVTTDSAGAITELNDYYAYGNPRTVSTTNTFTEARKYIGQYADIGTGLDYLNARYYNASYGRFLSQDPVFWGSQNLNDPQSLNSYSYANNNPIRFSDSSGNSILGSIAGFVGTAISKIAPILSVAQIVYDIFKPTVLADDAKYLSASNAITSNKCYPTATVGSSSSSQLVQKSYSQSAVSSYAASSTSALMAPAFAGIVSQTSNVPWTDIRLTPTQAINQQAKWLEGVENVRVQNAVKDFFRASDTMPGGTAGAIQWTKTTGQLVGGSDHIEKGYNFVNRFTNILREEVLSPEDLGVVKNILKKTLRALAE